MHKILAVAILCSAASCCMIAGETQPSVRFLLDEAGGHLVSWDLRQYEQTLQRAWQTQGNAEDRVEAGVALARELCGIHRKTDEARELLAATRALGSRPVLPLIALVRLEMLDGNYAAACDAARATLSVATNAQERRDARTEFGNSVCDEILHDTIRSPQGDTNSTSAETDARVREAFELLEPLIQTEPGWREPSRCQVLLALIAGDGPGALRAWKSYHLLISGGPMVPTHIDSPRDFGDRVLEDGKWTDRPLSFIEPGEVLAQLLPGFTDKADAATRERVVRAMAGSRFYPEAAALALRWHLNADKSIHEIVVYGCWVDNLSRRIAEHFRQIALGKSDSPPRLRVPHIVDIYLGRTRLQKIVASESKRLWKERNTPGILTVYRAKRFAQDLQRNFGTVMNAAGSCATFCAGHSALVTEPIVEQYGRKKVMKWVLLDSMICGAYGDWLQSVTGGSIGTVGGWVDPPAGFYQIRNDQSPRVWEAMTDPELHRRAMEITERLTAEDNKCTNTDSCGYFPGLAARLSVFSNDRIHERLKAQGLSGLELRPAFLQERDRLVNAGNLVAHEGRHGWI